LNIKALKNSIFIVVMIFFLEGIIPSIVNEFVSFLVPIADDLLGGFWLRVIFYSVVAFIFYKLVWPIIKKNRDDGYL
jgi:hypothetical protein